ncbi:MAG: ferrous iron transport protein A, partial [Lentisphaerae bacterium]|nr:ferrous iron transport protein A [Lentisphaerota bacterium]
GLRHRLHSIGLQEGKRFRVIAKHHLAGPLVLEVERRQISIGRGMARKIMVSRSA